MGVANHEEEPVDKWQGWCDVHQEYYWYEYRCTGCSNDGADRAIQDTRDERGRREEGL